MDRGHNIIYCFLPEYIKLYQGMWAEISHLWNLWTGIKSLKKSLILENLKRPLKRSFLIEKIWYSMPIMQSKMLLATTYTPGCLFMIRVDPKAFISEPGYLVRTTPTKLRWVYDLKFLTLLSVCQSVTFFHFLASRLKWQIRGFLNAFFCSLVCLLEIDLNARTFLC